MKLFHLFQLIILEFVLVVHIAQGDLPDPKGKIDPALLSKMNTDTTTPFKVLANVPEVPNSAKHYVEDYLADIQIYLLENKDNQPMLGSCERWEPDSPRQLTDETMVWCKGCLLIDSLNSDRILDLVTKFEGIGKIYGVNSKQIEVYPCKSNYGPEINQMDANEYLENIKFFQNDFRIMRDQIEGSQ